MRVTLLGGEEVHHLSCSQWVELLFAARVQGWKPAGTRQPFYFAWPDFGQGIWNASDYTSNMGQLVTPQDAAHLAQALMKVEAEGGAVPQGFIAFCEQGGFHLWDSSAVAEEDDQMSAELDGEPDAVPARRVA